MRLVEKWEKKMRKAKHEFAAIKTTKAIFDRVAAIKDLPTILIVQYPKSSSRNKNLNSANVSGRIFSIKQENIPKREIVGVRYYKD